MTRFESVDAAVHTVRAELVATVLEVTADLGDHVHPDTMLVLLDSMKMEIPVLAARNGVLTGMLVSAGDVVAAGDPLATVSVSQAPIYSGDPTG